MPGYHKYVSGWYKKNGETHPGFFEVVWTTREPVTPEQFQLMLEHYDITDVDDFAFEEITQEEFSEIHAG